MIEACLRELLPEPTQQAPPGFSPRAGRAAPPRLEAPTCIALPMSRLAKPPGVLLPKKGASGSDDEVTSVGTGSMKEETESEAEEGFQMKASAPCFVPGQSSNAPYLVPGLVNATRPSEAPRGQTRTPLRSHPCLDYIEYSPEPYEPSPVNIEVNKNKKGEVVHIKVSKLNVEVNKNKQGEVVHIRVSKKA